MDVSLVVWFKPKVASCVSQNGVTQGLFDFGVLVCVRAHVFLCVYISALWLHHSRMSEGMKEVRGILTKGVINLSG